MPTPFPTFLRAAAAGLRAARSLHFFEIWLLGMVAAMHLLFFAKGWGPMAWTFGVSLQVVGRMVLPVLPAGMVLTALWAGLRARSWRGAVRCARAWTSPAWWGLTLRIWLAIVLTVHVYIWLKLNVPFLNPVILDQAVWQWEERLFFGYSPNLFFLELFSRPAALQAVDWTYAKVFKAGLYIAMMFFPVLPSRRLRIACVTSYTVLWTLGGWLHVLLPALGPCYWFPSVWQPHAEWLRITTASQAALLKNYRDLMVFRFAADFQYNPLYGVAAIPSMHNANQALVALWVMRLSRPLGLLAWGGVAVIFIGSIVTGWHYLVDSVAGILLAWGVFAAVRRWLPEEEGGAGSGVTPP